MRVVQVQRWSRSYETPYIEMLLHCCYSTHAKVVSMTAVVGQYGISTVKAENRR